MWFGYSPFECDFVAGTNQVRVVECSALRVLSDIPKPFTYGTNKIDKLFIDLSERILKKLLGERLFISELLDMIAVHIDNEKSSALAQTTSNFV